MLGRRTPPAPVFTAASCLVPLGRRARPAASTASSPTSSPRAAEGALAAPSPAAAPRGTPFHDPSRRLTGDREGGKLRKGRDEEGNLRFRGGIAHQTEVTHVPCRAANCHLSISKGTPEIRSTSGCWKERNQRPLNSAPSIPCAPHYPRTTPAHSLEAPAPPWPCTPHPYSALTCSAGPPLALFLRLATAGRLPSRFRFSGAAELEDLPPVGGAGSIMHRLFLVTRHKLDAMPPPLACLPSCPLVRLGPPHAVLLALGARALPVGLSRPPYVKLPRRRRLDAAIFATASGSRCLAALHTPCCCRYSNPRWRWRWRRRRWHNRPWACLRGLALAALPLCCLIAQGALLVQSGAEGAPWPCNCIKGTTGMRIKEGTREVRSKGLKIPRARIHPYTDLGSHARLN